MEQIKPVFAQDNHEPEPPEEQAPTQVEPKEPKAKKPLHLLPIVFASVAVAGLGFGIYEFFQNSQKASENANLRSELARIKDEANSKSANEAKDSFYIHGMGIKINGLETPQSYTFSAAAQGPTEPTASFTIGYRLGIPKTADGTPIGTDFLPVENIATIYQYGENSLFDHEGICSNELGKIGEYNYCIAKLDCLNSSCKQGTEMAEEARQAWENAFNEISDEIFKTISDSSNYSAI